jgi:hypothetical protein
MRAKPVGAGRSCSNDRFRLGWTAEADGLALRYQRNANAITGPPRVRSEKGLLSPRS